MYFVNSIDEIAHRNAYPFWLDLFTTFRVYHYFTEFVKGTFLLCLDREHFYFVLLRQVDVKHVGILARCMEAVPAVSSPAGAA